MTKLFWWTICANICLLVGVGVAGAAQTVSFQNGINGYTAGVDNQLAAGYPDTPDTTGDVIWSDYPDNPPTNADNMGDQMLFRFDGIFGSGPGQIPLGSIINSATFTLHTTTVSGGPGAGGQLYRMLQTWSDTDTWNIWNGGIQADGIEALSTSFAKAGTSFSSNLNGAVAIDVTTDMQAWSNGTPYYGWAILPWVNGTNGWGVWSDSYSDTSMHPSLSVTFTTVPEPASALLVAAGMGMCLSRRKQSAQRIYR